MRLDEVVWKERFVDKLEHKHGVTTDEVEDVLGSRPHTRRVKRGRIPGEDLYAAYGQTEDGRYLIVFFLLKKSRVALPISAREMSSRERRHYGKRKKTR